ncbi:MAG: hypothetical protein O3B65_03290 [Chloroflexi bacterium]|nr:hypothetical protein [Chloroflexota bacterium]
MIILKVSLLFWLGFLAERSKYVRSNGLVATPLIFIVCGVRLKMGSTAGSTQSTVTV